MLTKNARNRLCNHLACPPGFMTLCNNDWILRRAFQTGIHKLFIWASVISYFVKLLIDLGKKVFFCRCVFHSFPTSSIFSDIPENFLIHQIMETMLWMSIYHRSIDNMLFIDRLTYQQANVKTDAADCDSNFFYLLRRLSILSPNKI